MKVMGNDATIINDLRAQVAALKALVEQLVAQCAEKDRIIAELTAQNAKLTATVKAQAAQIADLKGKLAAANKNSSNSSMPPSSDLFKPTPPKRRRKKKSGAKRGHPRHTRAPFPPEEVDEVVVVAPVPCPRCGHAMERLTQYGFCQQVELVEKPCRVTEFRAHTFSCPHCGKEHRPQFPPGVRRLLGERLTAAAAFLKADGHGSYRSIRRFFDDVFHLRASNGLLANTVARTSEALAPAHAELRERLKGEAVLNVDETSHKDAGRRHWTWAFCADGFVLFQIANGRGAAVLDEALGDDFAGAIGSDYYGAYRSFHERHPSKAQFCWAHLKREIRALIESPDRATASFGQRVEDARERLFRARRRKRPQRCLAAHALKVVRAIKGARASRPGIANLKKRFKGHAAGYLRFLGERIAPTNNVAERALRHCVIDRKVTQGTRGETGERWCERAWTAVMTCRKHGRSAFEFFREALRAYTNGTPAPSLLKNP